MSTVSVYRLLAAGPAVSAATAYRVGIGCLELWSQRTPQLAELGLESTAPHRVGHSYGDSLWDELVGLAEGATKVAYDEVLRGIRDVDHLSRTP
jgi:hypothetical protein